MKNKQTMTDADLRAVLRAGDPAPNGIELSNLEVQAMRKAILGIGVESRFPRFAWAGAVAAAALSAAVFGFFLWENRSTPRPQTPAPVAIAEKPERPNPPISFAEANPQVHPSVPPAATKKTTLPHRIVEKKPGTASPPITVVKGEPAVRQIFLTAPGGTQIVWLVETNQTL